MNIQTLLTKFLSENILARSSLTAEQSLKQFVAFVEVENAKDKEAAKQRSEKFMEEAEKSMEESEQATKVDEEMEIRELL